MFWNARMPNIAAPNIHCMRHDQSATPKPTTIEMPAERRARLRPEHVLEHVPAVERRDRDQVEEAPVEVDPEQVLNGEVAEARHAHERHRRVVIERQERRVERAGEQEPRDGTGQADDDVGGAAQRQDRAPHRLAAEHVELDLRLDTVAPDGDRVAELVHDDAHEDDGDPDEQRVDAGGSTREIRVLAAPAEQHRGEPEARLDLDVEAEQPEIHALEYPSAGGPSTGRIFAGRRRCVLECGPRDNPCLD